MNLAILIARFPPGVVGGAEIQAEQWARRLADRHRITVVTQCEDGEPPSRAERDGFTVVRHAVSRAFLVRTWRHLARIESAVRALAPRPDLALCFQTFLSGFAGVRLQRRLGIPAVVWVRGEDEFRPGRHTALLSIPVWDAARGVLVQSDAIRERVLAAVRTYRPAAEARIAAKTEVVPNGIELPVPAPPLAAVLDVLSVGRLIADKGMDVAIDAIASAGGRLTIAGPGPERERLAERARTLHADVRLEGAVPRERLDRLYRETGVVVLASRRGEGMPNALLEAFAYARPVIATPVGGVVDLVRDGENGLLVPPGDPAALRAALERLRSEAGLAARLSAAGRHTAERHAWERVRPRLEDALARWSRR